LAKRGVRLGVLVGTAYLFTEEAVRGGAITDAFQQAALACEQTVLLESGPGHATRCLPSPFAGDFAEEKRRLIQRGLPSEEIRGELEVLNIGRLRIASKGVDRHPRYGEDPSVPKLVELGGQEQWARGMYMIGQVASLQSQVRTIAALHADVSLNGTAALEDLAPERDEEPAPLPPADIAVVGIGTIMPGASDLQTFWDNIVNKVDAVREVPRERWDWHHYFDPDRNARDKSYSRWGGFIDPVPFDPVSFGMPPNSLKSIEPFQLLGLLVTQAALRDAGMLDRPFDRERTSVILGAGGGGADLSSNYVVRSSLPGLFGERAPELADGLSAALPEWTEDSFPGILMNVAAGRIANRFNFGGVNYTIDAACASSLAAVYQGVRELQAGTSEVAIVGGVDAIQNPFSYMCFSKTQALSPTGRCRPFDAAADGIAISEGFAALVLKRLADAERDGDRIYAVIRGAGGSSDGRDRSLTAPRPEGQIRALRRAYRQAGFSPATVELVEAHGTGTVAGDRAEVSSLSTFLGAAGAAAQNCAIGSVKSMVGHTKAAAGVAGLAKVALALHHRVLPATLGVSQPNASVNFPNGPIYVNTESRPWVHGAPDYPRRAGVSAFGFGGTNFHLVLEEYTGNFLPDQSLGLSDWPAELFVWRAHSRDEILAGVTRLATALERGARPPLADLAYTLARQAGTVEASAATLALVAGSWDELAEKLRGARDFLATGAGRQHLPTGVHFSAVPLAAEWQIAFLFPGQGSQYVNMARELAVVFPEVRAVFDAADQALDGRFEQPLSRLIFPPPVFAESDAKRQQAELTETNVAQPALGATGLAYLHLLRGLGVTPQMTAGHSYGEFVALHAAGCFDAATLLALSEARGRFMREGASEESGTMAAVSAAPEALQPLLADPELTLANLNHPTQTVVSGTHAAVERALAWCQEQGLRAQLLPVACAFHSPLVAPAQQRLAELLGNVAIAPPQMPVYSNTIAAPYPDDGEQMVALLAEHLVRPVEFVRQVRAMYAAGARVFVEVGPKSVLSGLVGRILGDEPHLCVPLDQAGRPSLVTLLYGLAALISEGTPVR
ncbi:MAG TPA: beta-ketoacyl synthase N-terminal-like domain-containing protein, partial [Nitrolancea sp.]|nr:beta-ketoacyl synthase N-terminal-like domain-containing protein [Nitrolancea sp.]